MVHLRPFLLVTRRLRRKERRIFGTGSWRPVCRSGESSERIASCLQQKVFSDLGMGVLDNAWAGYNCSLFAYGQTGSGKSYSIVGFKKNKGICYLLPMTMMCSGIVPVVCEELFKRIEENKENKKGSQYEVLISMFEIYCEKVCFPKECSTVLGTRSTFFQRASKGRTQSQGTPKERILW